MLLVDAFENKSHKMLIIFHHSLVQTYKILIIFLSFFPTVKKTNSYQKSIQFYLKIKNKFPPSYNKVFNFIKKLETLSHVAKVTLSHPS